MLLRTYIVGLFLVRFIHIQPCNTWHRYLSGAGNISVQNRCLSFHGTNIHWKRQTTDKITRGIMYFKVVTEK